MQFGVDQLRQNRKWNMNTLFCNHSLFTIWHSFSINWLSILSLCKFKQMCHLPSVDWYPLWFANRRTLYNTTSPFLLILISIPKWCLPRLEELFLSCLENDAEVLFLLTLEIELNPLPLLSSGKPSFFVLSIHGWVHNSGFLADSQGRCNVCVCSVRGCANVSVYTL